MNSLSEQQIEEYIRRAASAFTPRCEEETWEKPVEKADPDAWFLEGISGKEISQRKEARFLIRWATFAAACFAALIISCFRLYISSDATVYLDVNPSISVEVNRIGRVVSVSADNDDGRIILDNMSLINTEIDVAMNALLASMVKHGYLTSAHNTLLVSVAGKSGNRTAALQQRVTKDADQILKALLVKGIILGQTVDSDSDDDIEDLAKAFGITPGKAALVLRLKQDYPSLEIRDLAGMPVADLVRYCLSSGIDISRCLGENGEIVGDLDDLLDPDEADPNDLFDDYDHSDDDLADDEYEYEDANEHVDDDGLERGDDYDDDLDHDDIEERDDDDVPHERDDDFDNAYNDDADDDDPDND